MSQPDVVGYSFVNMQRNVPIDPVPCVPYAPDNSAKYFNLTKGLVTSCAADDPER
jgi:hypothetical protein